MVKQYVDNILMNNASGLKWNRWRKYNRYNIRNDAHICLFNTRNITKIIILILVLTKLTSDSYLSTNAEKL